MCLEVRIKYKPEDHDSFMRVIHCSEAFDLIYDIGAFCADKINHSNLTEKEIQTLERINQDIYDSGLMKYYN